MYAIDLDSVRSLDADLKKNRQPDGLGAEFQAMLDELHGIAALPQPDLSKADNAPDKVYAEIVVNGEVVAKVYNSGCAEMSNQAGARLLREFSEQMETGPELAQMRADRLAEVLGGSIVKKETAQSPAEWQKSKEVELSQPVMSGNIQADSMMELLEFLQNLKA